MEKTYNPCDNCRHSYSKNNQESGMCKICEFTYFKNLAPKNGEWVVADTLREDEDGTWNRYSCSECGCTTGAYYYDPQDISKFCPNCGAKMFIKMTHTCPHNIPNLIPTIEELLKGGKK